MFTRIKKEANNKLFSAYKTGDIEQFKQLILDGENINCISEKGVSLIEEIITGGRNLSSERKKQFFDIALDSGIHLGQITNNNQLLYLALQCRDEHYYMQKLIENGIDVNGKIERIETEKKIPLAIGEKPDTRFSLDPLMYYAIEKGDMKKIQLLIDNNYDLESVGKHGSCLFLILKNASIYHKGSFEYHHDLLKLFLKHGADPNKPNENGDTSLHLMAGLMGLNQKKKARIYNILLNNNANINITNKYGETPLMAAAAFGDSEIIKIYVNNGSDINKRNKKGMTCAMLAVEKNNFHIINQVKKMGADMSITDKKGRNIAHHLIISKKLNDEMMEFLKTNSDLLHIKDNKGYAPLDYGFTLDDKIYDKIEKYSKVKNKENNLSIN